MQVVDVVQYMVFNGLDMYVQVFCLNQMFVQVVVFYCNIWNGCVVVNLLGDVQVIGYCDGDYYVIIQVSLVGSGSKGDIGVVDVVDVLYDFQLGKGLL